MTGQLLGPRDLRKLTGVPMHVLNHALDRDGIEPVARIGPARVWDREQLPAIREALARSVANRCTPAGKTK